MLQDSGLKTAGFHVFAKDARPYLSETFFQDPDLLEGRCNGAIRMQKAVDATMCVHQKHTKETASAAWSLTPECHSLGGFP